MAPTLPRFYTHGSVHEDISIREVFCYIHRSALVISVWHHNTHFNVSIFCREICDDHADGQTLLRRFHRQEQFVRSLRRGFGVEASGGFDVIMCSFGESSERAHDRTVGEVRRGEVGSVSIVTSHQHWFYWELND